MPGCSAVQRPSSSTSFNGDTALHQSGRDNYQSPMAWLSVVAAWRRLTAITLKHK
ncbi:Hypothetical predicted protein [Scomber scombrus]|uniref:Uncharacterized protein n=1 Tax=Scomber scombrus TaxID=13677 RepID=A0AAV1NAI2_SCOSC